MPEKYKKITLGELIDNIEKNGYKHIRHQAVATGTNNRVLGACALGQGLLNLEIQEPFFSTVFGRIENPVGRIIKLNDTPKRKRWWDFGKKKYRTIQEIVDVMRNEYKDYLNYSTFVKERKYARPSNTRS